MATRISTVDFGTPAYPAVPFARLVLLVPIKANLRKGKTDKEIHGELADVYGSSAPSYAQVKFWVGEFKCGRTSLEDESRSRCPLYATDEEKCKKVPDLVYTDRRIQVEEIMQALRISHGSVSTILHDGLGMR